MTADVRHLEEVIRDRNEFFRKADSQTPLHYEVRRFGRGEAGRPIKRLLLEFGVSADGHVLVLDESFDHPATFSDTEAGTERVDNWVRVRENEGATRGRWRFGAGGLRP